SFHFKTPLEVKDFFKDAGFSQVNVEQPQIFFGQVSKNSDEEHLGDLVWTIHTQLK
ncbi:class I SAM-dependent methyltransferase, partial [Acinetobacter baumannii]